MAEIKTALMALQLAAPFKPYEIRLSDGRIFSVPEREYLAIAPMKDNQVILFEGPDQAFEFYDFDVFEGATIELVGAPEEEWFDVL